VYADPSEYRPYVYEPAAVDRYWEARQVPDRVMFAVTLSGEPIGEVQLKRIDRAAGECTLSIHLRSNDVKDRGYGTAAEKLALEYAFEELGMQAVNADALVKNTRSQRALVKAGFRFLQEADGFRYYRCTRPGRRIDAEPESGI
jgi:RimJ/RimL family protein N-acetyltransferase